MFHEKLAGRPFAPIDCFDTKSLLLPHMNDLRTAVVGLFAVVVGFAGAWMVFGGRAARLEEENSVLRDRQRNQLVQEIDSSSGESRRMLVGRWATTIDKSRLGRIELVFELREDGSVLWQSLNDQEFTTIAKGKWRLEDEDIHFTVTIVDENSPDKGEENTTVARINELTAGCLSLIVDGDNWSFHRASA